MWANVLARQPVASGRVQDGNNPNLMLEPKTGSIYMKKSQTREVEKDRKKLWARSLNFTPTERWDWEIWITGFWMTNGAADVWEIHFNDDREEMIVPQSLPRFLCLF